MLSTTASAFDDRREGLIVGVGVGIAPFGNSSIGLSSLFLPEDIGNPEVKVRQVSAAGTLQLGYGLNSKNAISLNANMILYKSDPAFDRVVLQGFMGAVWSHYFARERNSLFTILGFGMYRFEIQGLERVNPGLGTLLGLGYKFSQLHQITANFSIGKASQSGIYSGTKQSMTHKHISILFEVLAF